MVINPIITVAAGIFGLLCGLMRMLAKGEGYFSILLCESLPHVICSMGIKTAALHMLYGTPWLTLLWRVPVYILIIFVETTVVYILYKKNVMKFMKAGRAR